MNTTSGISPIKVVAKDCINCGICLKECAFLQEYGSPQIQASRWLESAKNNLQSETYPFECSLCGLCHGVCPKDLDPSAMFLAMRRELSVSGHGRLKVHKAIRAYEKRGSSSLLSWYYFPLKCHTVLFPGCALPGSRPQTLNRLFLSLQKLIPDLGLVLDCCTKPSHDLGDSAHFSVMFQELCNILQAHSITKVLVACPNCYRIFSEYGKIFEVRTVYEELAETATFRGRLQKEITLHDPCGVRFASEVQSSVRALVHQQGLTVREMPHKLSKSFCCGEGGAAGFLRSDFAMKWTEKRVREADGTPIVSYCAGCTHFLGRAATTYHLLDLILFPDATLGNTLRVSRAPMTYWNRYRFKKIMRKNLSAGISGNRKRFTLVPCKLFSCFFDRK
jgi:Fe-S oxidoreductase